MNNSNKQELATRFYMLAILFETAYWKYAYKGVVNFSKPLLTQNECNTVACHGGWAHLLITNPTLDEVDYSEGSQAITRFLNLEVLADVDHLDDWIAKYPKLWGVDVRGLGILGLSVFDREGYLVFGFSEDDYYGKSEHPIYDADDDRVVSGKLTLLTIANYYKKVCVNILNSIN